MASLRDVSFGGSGGKEGTIGLREGSVKRFVSDWTWIDQEGSSPSWASKESMVFLRFSEGSFLNR
jgi:hypothetical protein